MSTLSIRLPDDIDQLLTEEARLEDRPRSAVVREAISAYLGQRERERLMAGLVTDVQTLRSDPSLAEDGRRLEADFSAADAEALDSGEASSPAPAGDDEDWWE